MLNEMLIRGSWSCDWCSKEVITTTKDKPSGWLEAVGDCIMGEHWCGDKCYKQAEEAWEESYDVGMNAQCEFWEKQRLTCIDETNRNSGERA